MVFLNAEVCPMSKRSDPLRCFPAHDKATVMCVFMRRLDEGLNQAQSLKYAVTTQYRNQIHRVESLFKKLICQNF
jgi:hypothetical protein